LTCPFAPERLIDRSPVDFSWQDLNSYQNDIVATCGGCR